MSAEEKDGTVIHSADVGEMIRVRLVQEGGREGPNVYFCLLLGDKILST